MLLQATPPHRRARSAAWSYIFLPEEAWCDLTIHLPAAVLLKEIHIQPHLASLASKCARILGSQNFHLNNIFKNVLGPMRVVKSFVLYMFISLLPSMPILSVCGDQCRWCEHAPSVDSSHHQRSHLHQVPAGKGRGGICRVSEVAPAKGCQHAGPLAD